MQHPKEVLKGTFFLVLSLFFVSVEVHAADFDNQKFIDVASLRCVSELEAAKIALQKATLPEVRAYAEAMIGDHMTVCTGLRSVAQSVHLQMLSDAELQARARTYVFERKGETFDTAYAGKRAAERRKTVNLFREAVGSDNAPLKRYAEVSLPVLMHELYLAQELVAVLNANSSINVKTADLVGLN